MDYILDTHIALWALDDSDQLPLVAREIINDTNNNIYFSAISVMEVSIKHNKYPSQFKRSGEDFYMDSLEYRFYTIPFKPKHSIAMDSLNIKDGSEHNYPFDRALLSQAKHEGFKLITHDKSFDHYDENCVVLV